MTNISTYHPETSSGTLPRPFKNDKSVDLSSWTTKPSQLVVGFVGDLSNPDAITFERALEIGIRASELDAEGASQLDMTYAMNAFGFVVDNLFQQGRLNEQQKAQINAITTRLGK